MLVACIILAVCCVLCMGYILYLKNAVRHLTNVVNHFMEKEYEKYMNDRNDS